MPELAFGHCFKERRVELDESGGDVAKDLDI